MQFETEEGSEGEKVWGCQGTRNEKNDQLGQPESARVRMNVCACAYICLIRLSSGNSWITAKSTVCPTKQGLSLNRNPPLLLYVSCKVLQPVFSAQTICHMHDRVTSVSQPDSNTALRTEMCVNERARVTGDLIRPVAHLSSPSCPKQVFLPDNKTHFPLI